MDRCDSGSNRRMDSISSPKNSTRTGCACSGEKTSRMPPADGIFTDHFHRIAALVADAFEMRGEIVERHFVVQAQRLRQLTVVVRRFGTRERRGDRRERNAAVAIGKLRKRGSPRGQNLGMRRHVLARQHVERRQQKRSAGIAGINQAGKGLEHWKHRLGLFVSIHHDQLRPAGGVMQQHCVESLGRQREPGKAQDLGLAWRRSGAH